MVEARAAAQPDQARQDGSHASLRSVSRRAFLTGGSAAALALVVLPTKASAATGPRSPFLSVLGPGGFKESSFRAQVGTIFQVQAAATRLDLTLTGVTNLAQRTIRGKALTGQQFSLVFTGALPALPQGTYPIRHSSLGRLTLFLVPVDRSQATAHAYQAIVNNAHP